MIDEELVHHYERLFVNRDDVWAQQWASNKTGKHGYMYWTPDKKKYEPMQLQHLIKHMDGDLTLAFTALDPEGMGKWIVCDSDHDNEQLDSVEKVCRTAGMNSLREGRRTGRPGHLWLLFDKKIPGVILRTLGLALIKLAGATLKCKAYPEGLELFPKSLDGLTQVKAPFGINLKPDANKARAWFDGVPQDVETQLRWLLQQPLNSADDAICEAEKYSFLMPTVPAKKKVSAKKRTQDTVPTFDNATTQRLIDLLGMEHFTEAGAELIGRCPACAQDGTDTHEDNLKINLSSGKFCCVEGGPGATHNALQIMTAAEQSVCDSV